MKNLRLVLEYDGGDFHGWQRNPGVRTVEGVLRDALMTVTGEEPVLTASGRTDAGVHAHAQVVGVSLEKLWSPEALRGALNANLPEDVAVRDVTPAPERFHARFDAVNRTYRYLVLPRDCRAPHLRRTAWCVKGALDVDAMRAAAAMLVGRRDFGSLGRAPHPQSRNTVRTLHSLDVYRKSVCDSRGLQPAVVIEACADAFLYGMVRNLAGLLVAVGQGRLAPADVPAVLAGDPVRQRVVAAPAQGLHQWSVVYGDENGQD